MNFTLNQLLNGINQFILNPLIGLLFFVALIVFLWGVFRFVANAGSEDARETGKRNMMWGILGMFIMVAAFGIIRLVLGTFGITGPGASKLPGWLFNL